MSRENFLAVEHEAFPRWDTTFADGRLFATLRVTG